MSDDRPIPVGSKEDRAAALDFALLAWSEGTMAEEGASEDELRAAFLRMIRRWEKAGTL